MEETAEAVGEFEPEVVEIRDEGNYGSVYRVVGQRAKNKN